MLEIDQIKQFYKGSENVSERNMLREYMQYKILDLIFGSGYGSQLSFMGGTAIRIVYGGNRFSEDLDFDNFGLKEKEFDLLVDMVKKGLEAEGLDVEVRNVHRGAFRCYLKIPGILFDYGLTGHREEKILIQIDTTLQKFPFEVQLAIINKFGVFSEIRTNSSQIILAQKIDALLHRKRLMGRDLYDIVYLASITKPHEGYLSKKLNIGDVKELKQLISQRLRGHSLKNLAEDVIPFVADPGKLDPVIKFDRWLESWSY